MLQNIQCIAILNIQIQQATKQIDFSNLFPADEFHQTLQYQKILDNLLYLSLQFFLKLLH